MLSRRATDYMRYSHHQIVVYSTPDIVSRACRSYSTSNVVTRQVRLKERPVGIPERHHFEVVEEAVPSLAEGQVLVKTEFISLDPAMRGWLRDIKSYLPPVQIGEVMRALVAGRVVESRHPKYAVGDFVTRETGSVQTYIVSGNPEKEIYHRDTSIAPPQTYLGGLGMTGLTAYFGLLDIGKPQPGDTVVVSAAAGAVGTSVGQIAKIKGCRVVGIAGGADKCAYIRDELGFDAVIDYKTQNVMKGLRETCPQGINIYFDNVGGDILDAALARLTRGARVVVCGAISQYNKELPEGPRNYLSLLVNRARMEGFLVFDYARQYKQALEAMAGWHKSGQLKFQEHIVEGDVDGFPDALRMLFTGENKGKLILKIK